MERQLEFSVDKIFYINIEKKEKIKSKRSPNQHFFSFLTQRPLNLNTAVEDSPRNLSWQLTEDALLM